jgi:hypothetical protein
MRDDQRFRAMPGALLLRLARWMLDDQATRAFVEPVIADLQHELRLADASVTRRLAARWHGYLAFWRVIMMTPIAAFDGPLEDRLLTTLFGRQRVGPLLWMMIPLFAALWPEFAWFGVGTVIAGIITAVAMRRWHDRHPTTVPMKAAGRHQSVEINLAAIHVDGNVGGMFFALGSVAIVMAGLPQYWVLFVTSLAGGVLLAVALSLWHTWHPMTPICRNSLIAR